MKKLIIAIVILLFPFITFAVVFEKDLFFGISNNPDVTKLQEFLTDEGVYDGPVTGNFFTLTRQGVINFQKRENIAPAAGYFGPLTRARANELIKPASREDLIAKLSEQIALLRASIAELRKQRESCGESAVSAIDEDEEVVSEIEEEEEEPADTIAPVFTKTPQVDKKGFMDIPMPFGPHYAYEVIFDWAVDETGFLTESITCAPPLKHSKVAGKNTKYYPEPRTEYSCVVTVKDEAGNDVSGDVEFQAPSWIGFEGLNDAEFPSVKTTPLKLGEITIYNGTSTSVLFDQIRMKVTDNMNSPLNRGREVKFVIRNGLESTDPSISTTKHTFHSKAPELNNPHKAFVDMSYPVLYEPGEERTFSLWVEDLDYVISGTLDFEFEKFFSPINISPAGNFKFTLSREI